MDFAASDSPDAIHELSPADEDQYLLFPSVVGAVTPIVNLPGVSGEIALTPEALAGIYLGKIVKWNDPNSAPGQQRPESAGSPHRSGPSRRR
ncbi:MAG: hypothetical protein WDO73_17630 [Ignavibacteriota bacterium]